ncbi:MAG: glycosyltransferase, partial [Nanopusillaceae archaeon]
MKILLFHPWIKSKGGGERLVYEYIKRSKHKISIFTWYYAENKSFDFKNVKYIIKYNDLFDKIYRSYFFRALLSFFLIFIKIPSINYDLLLIS